MGLLAISAVMTVWFLYCERRTPEPIIPLELFRNRMITVSIVALTLTATAMFGTILFVPLFIQGVIGTSATASGSALTPMMVAMIVSSLLCGQYISRSGRYRTPALLGVGVMIVGIFLLSTLGTNASYSQVILYMILVGLGLGAIMPIFTLVVQNAVQYSQLGAATSLTQFFRSIGGTLGAALFGSLLTNRFTPAFHAALTPEVLAVVPADRIAQFENPQLLLNPASESALQQAFSDFGPGAQALLDQIVQAIRIGLATSIHELFLLGTAIGAVAWLVLLLLEEVPLRRTHAVSSTAQADASALNADR
jgi:MFS family permease